MNSDLGSCLRLARGLLRLYGLAVASKHRGVADHLLCALEQLAKSEPAIEQVLDRAYLWGIGHHGSVDPHTPRAEP
ncbi:MAG TPA: hypothetical protein VFQ16_00500 [Burkholderiaceae bacterium]|jgi:hypothetical protein|uniref:hypothetical protein n=1 Tax=Piscinibacter TaxID=1114981 RepID=UPI000FDED00A|nr:MULTISPECIES: hypothetical protein [Piscinibacter]MBP6029737.1 hypothetical protein [Piscinibacter sp.]HET9820280.1 hypothetical protein [Burkholderiaceae bacterium]